MKSIASILLQALLEADGKPTKLRLKGNAKLFFLEQDDNGVLAQVKGMENIEIYCPRCDALLPREIEHRCGDRAL